MPVRRYLIEGRVQGVGFRYFARAAARGLGLSGFVRNLPDGSVEAVAGGSSQGLDALERALSLGPRGARVDSVQVAEHAIPLAEGDFVIR